MATACSIPTVRLGVTGLSRAGKTVFITALVHGLTRGGRLPVFERLATGRIARARLEPQPDDAVPRFDYENHVRALTEERRWPNSTGRHQRAAARHRLSAAERRGPHASRSTSSTIPASGCSTCRCSPRAYEQWSAESLALSRARTAREACGALARRIWRRSIAEAREDEQAALTVGRAVHRLSARLPRRALRHEPAAARPLPDARRSRGLAGADLRAARRAGRRQRAGGLAVGDDGAALRGLQGRRGAAVLPRSFRAARPPDRAGRRARRVQRRARGAARSRSRAGRDPRLLPHRPHRRFVSSLFRPRIDRILFAATKADHLHHSSHDRLEAILRRMVDRAADARRTSPAPPSTWWRSPRCAQRARRRSQRGREKLPSIIGTPAAGESANGELFDGETEVATFPGRPARRSRGAVQGDGFRGPASAAADEADYRFLRFRPPQLERDPTALARPAPHPPRPCAAIPDRRPTAMSEDPQARGLQARRSRRGRGGRRRARPR